LVRLPPELGRSGDDDAALFMVSTWAHGPTSCVSYPTSCQA
jgi:hypothetical protein